ncbi:MAG: signal peptidase I [Candidatus Niyogibacteria bacterium RIFCSPLOWO2_01_FULL_45_48]|uniref:Signal peptidase I n=2 Tax=Candidatus Niyogiibacteriota TaxID=1817912 RepID=A0A1G2F0X4_9BACT|nr:MAG: signal peptidase I [Candidatus Niyogibacteria bacterium RIFCSPLOWO2_01_FULL_45_48]OGZ30948.1 MAG: signal peptidase I [Candidatus Niyogibacteria bacterium RIFCSPHIGHO2_01_FULL_45_28]OGZ31211.1 MAG: signal peptidase I [Candidatus Niyogibacteria bacterium RIFCSPLOWO2_02_FULL_45_13]
MQSKFLAGVWEIVKFGLIVLVIVMPIRLYIAQPFIVAGESMAPTFSSGDYLIIDELTYNFIKEPSVGEVVVFRYPQDPSKYFIKRIVGLPGEELVVDGVEWKLGDGEYFVMGDNTRFSLDSRSWGVLPRENITGRALLRLWPPTAFAYMPGDEN